MIPSLGGDNPYLRLLASALANRGIRVSLAQRRGWRPLHRAVSEHGRPDIIHLQWQHRFFVPRSGSFWRSAASTALFFQQWIALQATGIRFVWTVHNLVHHERERETWELLACRLLARAVDAIVVHCSAAVPLVAEAYRIPTRRIHVIPQGHYMDWHPPAASREVSRSTLGLPADARVLLFFGQIREYKGVEQLLAAFSTLADAAVRLVVLGKPKTAALGRSLLEQASADPRVFTTLEFVEDELLVAYLSACDAVVLPYTDSLNSSAAVLAASCGRPVIIPALGCLKEFPTDAAVLYEPELPDALGEALQRALSMDLDAMGEAAKRYVGRFAWPEISERLDGLYASLIGVGKNGN